MLPSGWTSDGSGKDEKVIIVGGGLVGALAGIYMSRLGYNVHVYEKRPGTHWHSLRLINYHNDH